MGKISNIFTCCAQNFRKWPTNPRLYVLGLLLIAFQTSYVLPISQFSRAVYVPATPWIFPFLTSDPTLLLMLMLGIVMLFCDAPFIDAHQPYLIIRAGKRNWLLGQIGYIMLASALYFFFIIMVSVLLLLPNLTFSFEWGKILGTLALTDAGTQFKSILPISYSLQLNYTPVEAMAYNFLMNWLVGTFLGLLIFVLNMRFRREIGVIISTFLVFLQFFYFSTRNLPMFCLSPVSWASLINLDITHTSALPSITYAVSVLIGLNLILIFLAHIIAHKKDIDVLTPV